MLRKYTLLALLVLGTLLQVSPAREQAGTWMHLVFVRAQSRHGPPL